MNRTENRKMRSWRVYILCGALGCVCMGTGDWLMIYGDPSPMASLKWLTQGAADIAAWRNHAAMALAFPGVTLYMVALLGIAQFLTDDKRRLRYRLSVAFSMLPWLSLHLIYCVILFAFSYLNGIGQQTLAAQLCEAVYTQFSWTIPLSEVFMLPPFIYWAYLVWTRKSVFPRGSAALNPLVLFAVLKGATMLLPASAAKLAFTNGLMSESMILWFAGLALLKNREERTR